MMFIYAWAHKIWDVAAKHPGIVIGSLPAMFIVLGLIYRAAFFLPLDVPIFSLSLLSDFILPGLHQSLVIVVIVVITISCVIFFVLLAVGFIGFLLCRIISILFSMLSRFLWMLVSTKILLFHTICASVTWLFYMPNYYIHWIFGKTLDILPIRSNFFGGVKQKSEWLQKNYFLAKDKLSERREKRRENLETTLMSITERKIKLVKCLSDCIGWASINRRLSESSRWLITFLFLSFGSVAAATAYKACYDRCLVEDNGGVEFDSREESSFPNKISGYRTLLENVYEKWLFPTSKVQVRLRSGRHESQNLLQVGGTSDFLLFWDDKQSMQVCSQSSADKSANAANAKPKGEILIVPKSNILFIQPSDTNNMPADEDSCKHESKDIVEAIDNLNDTLHRN